MPTSRRSPRCGAALTVGSGFDTVTVTDAEASVVPFVFLAASVIVPVPFEGPPKKSTVIVVVVPASRATEVGERVQLPGTRLPLHVVTTRLNVSELRVESVNVVLPELFAFTLAVPLPSCVRLTVGILPKPGVAARTVRDPSIGSSASATLRGNVRQRVVRRSMRRTG
jgi:hypothetical protein